MNARLLREPTSVPRLLSYGAQICGVVLFVGWLAFVIGELIQSRFAMPDVGSFYQAAALLTVFAGYLVSRWHAIGGSLLAIGGTIGFFAVAFATSGVLPPMNALWFVAPAVLTLMAWNATRHYRKHRVR